MVVRTPNQIAVEALDFRRLLSYPSFLPNGTTGLDNERATSVSSEVTSGGTRAVIAWVDANSGNGETAHFRVYKVNVTQTGWQELSSTVNLLTSLDTAHDPAVAISGDEIVAVWVERDTGDPWDSRLLLRRFSLTGSPIGSAVTVFQKGDTIGGAIAADVVDLKAPQVGVDGDGNAFVTWTLEVGEVTVDGDSGFPGYEVGYATLDSSNELALSPSFVVSPQSPFPTRETPDVAVNDHGEAVVTWSQHPVSGPNHDVYARRFDMSSGPQASEFVVSNSNETEEFPRVGISDAANFGIVWHVATGNGPYFGGQLFDWDEDTISDPLTLQDQPSVSVDIDMRADGTFGVAYNVYAGVSSANVYFEDFDASGTAQYEEPFQVNATAGLLLGTARVFLSTADDSGSYPSSDGTSAIAHSQSPGPNYNQYDPILFLRNPDVGQQGRTNAAFSRILIAVRDRMMGFLTDQNDWDALSFLPVSD
jgi:hypothetical protein